MNLWFYEILFFIDALEASMRFCYCESPLQLSESIEYNSYNPVPDVFFLIRDNGGEAQRAQFVKLLGADDNYKFISMPREGWGKALMVPLFFMLVLLKATKIEGFVVGDARSLFVRAIYILARVLEKDIVLVDDGLYLLRYWRRIAKKKYTFFTSLPLGRVSGDSKLQIIEKRFSKVVPSKGKADVFIGMKLVEIGYMSQEMYFSALQLVADRSGRNGLVYYAHREESTVKLDSIEGLGYKIIRPDLPLELFVKRHGAYAGSYYSFYSTALYNLSKMIPGVGFFSLSPGDNYWPHDSANAVNSCYELFEAGGVISILNINKMG